MRSQLNEEAKGIEFISGKGKGKSQTQRAWEEKQVLLERWERYEEMLSIKGGKGATSIPKPPRTLLFPWKRKPAAEFFHSATGPAFSLLPYGLVCAASVEDALNNMRFPLKYKHN